MHEEYYYQPETTPEPEVYTISALLPPSLEDLELPAGYGVKGGAARAIAAYTLFGEVLPVRDVDLVALPNADMSLARELAAKYMPDDYHTGIGAETVETITDLISERDFTINEVAVVGGQVFITEDAFTALRDKKIELADEIPGNKMKAKAQLLAAALEAADFNPTVSEELAVDDINPFWCGLMLNRALEQGYDVAQLYTDRINASAGTDFKSPEELAVQILEDEGLHNVSFSYIEQVSRWCAVRGLAKVEGYDQDWEAAIALGESAVSGSQLVIQEGY